jgi:hypothetical protein
MYHVKADMQKLTAEAFRMAVLDVGYVEYVYAIIHRGLWFVVASGIGIELHCLRPWPV